MGVGNQASRNLQLSFEKDCAVGSSSLLWITISCRSPACENNTPSDGVSETKSVASSYLLSSPLICALKSLRNKQSESAMLCRGLRQCATEVFTKFDLGFNGRFNHPSCSNAQASFILTPGAASPVRRTQQPSPSHSMTRVKTTPELLSAGCRANAQALQVLFAKRLDAHFQLGAGSGAQGPSGC